MIDEKDQLISNLENEVRRLRDENKKLEETVQWMHDLIWQMVREREEQKDGEISSQTAEKACGDPCIIKKGLSRKRNPATAYKQTFSISSPSGGLICV